MSIGNVSKTLTCDSLYYVFVLTLNNDNLLIEEIISKFWAKAKINIIEQFFFNTAFPPVSVTRGTFGVQAVISITSLTSCFDTMTFFLKLFHI